MDLIAFTDKQLSSVKHAISIIFKQLEPGDQYLDLSRHHIINLIERLEAAKKVCAHIRDNWFPKSMRDKAYDYMNEWLLSKGEEAGNERHV